MLRITAHRCRAEVARAVDVVVGEVAGLLAEEARKRCMNTD